MAPLTSPILSAVARRQLQQTTIRRFGARQYTTAKAARAPAEWSSQWKKVGGSAMMYFPVVAVVMFWPYAVSPLFDKAYGI